MSSSVKIVNGGPGKPRLINRVVNAANTVPDGFLPIGNNDGLAGGLQDTAYAGTWAPYFILPATYGMDSINKGLFYVKDGIRKEHTIGSLDFSNPWAPVSRNPTLTSFTAGANPSGPIAVGGRKLIPQTQMLYQEFDPRDLELTAWSEVMSETLLSRELPQEVESYIVYQIVRRAFEQVENEIWMGSQAFQTANGSTYTNTTDAVTINGIAYQPWQIQFFDGIFAKVFGNGSTQTTDYTYANYAAVTATYGNTFPVYVTNNPATFQVPNAALGAGVALTPQNIGDAMQNLYQAASTYNRALLANPKAHDRLKFIMSVNTRTIYEQYLTTQPFKNNDTTEAGINRYKGFDVVAVAGLPNDTIIFTEAIAATDGNLFFGLNSVLDENFQLVRTMAASETFFVKMLMKMDVNYGFGNKLFIYSTLTEASFAAGAF
jgi:hypothetical protein